MRTLAYPSSATAAVLARNRRSRWALAISSRGSLPRPRGRPRVVVSSANVPMASSVPKRSHVLFSSDDFDRLTAAAHGHAGKPRPLVRSAELSAVDRDHAGALCRQGAAGAGIADDLVGG